MYKLILDKKMTLVVIDSTWNLFTVKQMILKLIINKLLQLKKDSYLLIAWNKITYNRTIPESMDGARRHSFQLSVIFFRSLLYILKKMLLFFFYSQLYSLCFTIFFFFFYQSLFFILWFIIFYSINSINIPYYTVTCSDNTWN